MCHLKLKWDKHAKFSVLCHKSSLFLLSNLTISAIKININLTIV